MRTPIGDYGALSAKVERLPRRGSQDRDRLGRTSCVPLAELDRNCRRKFPRSSFVPEVKLTAELRTEFGKGAARRIRRAHKVPAVLYGHGTAPIHISLPGHETLLALRTANALLAIEVNGSSQLALPKQVQRDPLKHTIEHVDLVIVRRGEKVTVDVRVHVEGEAAPDTLIVVDHNRVPVEAEATHIPQQIVVSVEDLPPGTQILARDLQLPAGSTVVDLDPETLI